MLNVKFDLYRAKYGEDGAKARMAEEARQDAIDAAETKRRNLAIWESEAEAVSVTAPATKEKDTTPGDGWREKARAIADECFDHDTNAKPTVRDSLATKNSGGHITGGYCFRVMGLMQERGIKGARGIITNPATIMRDALQGKQWWANKSK